ncbi:MAG: hypothetical protein PHW01_00785 [Patescibacteria group bacterium]|nr:hypothetical protein [Patescibacteria group bacterium]
MAKRRKIEILLLAAAIIGIWVFSLYPDPPIRKLSYQEKRFGMILTGKKYVDCRSKLHITYKDWGADGNLDEAERNKIINGNLVKEKVIFTETQSEAEKGNADVGEFNHLGNFVPKDPHKRYVWNESPEGQTWQEKFEKLLEDYNRQ